MYVQMVDTNDTFNPVFLDVKGPTSVRGFTPYVFFGRKANPSEQYVNCKVYASAPGYLVLRWQRNPAQ